MVEDEPRVLELTSELLRGSGYTVLSAGTPQEALEEALTHRGTLDLVFTDVVLPGMKGPELYERIRETHPEARVLYMSGYTENVIVNHGVLKEGIRFLAKPFTIRGLQEKVAGALAV